MTANITLARLQQLLPQLFDPLEVTGDPYLRFQLTPDISALLSMERVQEAVLVPANSISPLPNLPALTIGMMNSRDRVFCVVDLGQVMGLPPIAINPRDYQVIVIYLDSIDVRAVDPALLSSVKCLGLAVSQIRGVVRLEPSQLQSNISDVPECLTPYLIGSFEEPDRRSIVLDAMAIATAPTLLHNPYAGWN
jgi:positive phototaxis protein PixI